MKHLLILGANSDIAKALAGKFAGEGFSLYLATRRQEDIAGLMEKLKETYNIRARTLRFDTLDYRSHKGFYEALNPKPEGVICSVGLLGVQKEAEGDFELARNIIDTNYTGCVSMLNIIAEDFEKRGSGFIIGISSAAGERGRGSNYIYGSAKAGFSAYLSGLRNRLFKSNVYVMTVKPGFVHTKMTQRMNLPPLLTATPERAAEDIFRAWQKRKDVVYTRWFWRYIMLAIRNIPEALFKRMKL